MGASASGGSEGGFSWAAIASKNRRGGIRPVLNNHESVGGGGGQDECEEGGAGDEDELMSDDVIQAQPMSAPPVRVAKALGSPTAEEKEAHDCTHMPYRAWCPVCVEARGKEDGHFKQGSGVGREKPLIGLDYKAFGQEEKGR